MPHTPETSSSILDQISEIQDEAKKNKVKLTPEVTQYIREHLEAVQQKLANGVSVTDDDMKFMQDVRLWVSLPEEWRKKCKSIEDMKQNTELRGAGKEASARGISIRQWLDLLHIAEVSQTDKKWIDKNFRFPGNGKIENISHLFIRNRSFTSLPDNLHVRGILDLRGCTSLTSLPDNLRAEVMYFADCTSLTSLPEDLEVGKDLYLSKNLQEQVKRDAERLKKEGKIKGEIKYE